MTRKALHVQAAYHPDNQLNDFVSESAENGRRGGAVVGAAPRQLPAFEIDR